MIHYHADPDLAGVYLIEPDTYGDARGYFAETYRTADFAEKVSSRAWVQENESSSSRGVLRGLHLQRGEAAQAKLVRCVSGEIIDLIVDLRLESDTYGQWRAYHLSESNHRQLYIPRQFAHGFLVLSEQAKFLYKVDNAYAPETELCIRYDDPQLAIPWHTWAQDKGLSPDALLLSDKDLRGISLADYTFSLSMTQQL